MELIPVYNAKQNHCSQMLRTLDANLTCGAKVPGSLVGKSFGIGERFKIKSLLLNRVISSVVLVHRPKRASTD